MYLYVKLNRDASYFFPVESKDCMNTASYQCARRGDAEVAGWTLDRKIRVRFPAYPHRVWALWWQGGKRRLRTSGCPCRGRLGTLKTPSCPWRGCPAAGQNLETGHLSRHYIAEISLNVTLDHNQQQQQQNRISAEICRLGRRHNLCPLEYKKIILLRRIHHFKSDLIHNCDNWREKMMV